MSYLQLVSFKNLNTETFLLLESVINYYSCKWQKKEVIVLLLPQTQVNV